MEPFEAAFLSKQLTVYRNLSEDCVFRTWSECVQCVLTAGDGATGLAAVSAYAQLCHLLYESESNGNFSQYLYQLVLKDCNVFTLAAAAERENALGEELLLAARRDLHALYELSRLPAATMKKWLCDAFPQWKLQISTLSDYISGEVAVSGDWGDNLASFMKYHNENGVGIYAKANAFLFELPFGIQPVESVDPVRLADLKKYEVQRNKIVDNTRSFLAGHPYHNVLLYGDRGTGKSSTVKALLNEFSGEKLRMIELGKRHIADMDKLIREVQHIPMKFIVFIDDLTFNENDDNFGVLKAMLEGSLSMRPKNVAIYATTNRRHLIKENFTAREGSEVHRGDTIDENLSLADRFGLTVTFMKPDQNEYLDIVRALAFDRKLQVEEEKLLRGAEQFALMNSGRSPRVAKQYIDNLEAIMMRKQV